MSSLNKYFIPNLQNL